MLILCFYTINYVEVAGCKNIFLPGGRCAGGIINWGGRVQKKFFLPGGRGAGGIFSWGGRVQNHFSDLTFFFEIQFKNTLNLIFPSFQVPSKSFLFKNLKTGLTFWRMWFFNFQNLVRSCQHIDVTPCICTYEVASVHDMAKTINKAPVEL